MGVGIWGSGLGLWWELLRDIGFLGGLCFFCGGNTVKPRYEKVIRHGPPIAYSETLLIANIYIYIYILHIILYNLLKIMLYINLLLLFLLSLQKDPLMVLEKLN